MLASAQSTVPIDCVELDGQVQSSLNPYHASRYSMMFTLVAGGAENCKALPTGSAIICHGPAAWTRHWPFSRNHECVPLPDIGAGRQHGRRLCGVPNGNDALSAGGKCRQQHCWLVPVHVFQFIYRRIMRGDAVQLSEQY